MSDETMMLVLVSAMDIANDIMRRHENGTDGATLESNAMIADQLEWARSVRVISLDKLSMGMTQSALAPAESDAG